MLAALLAGLLFFMSGGDGLALKLFSKERQAAVKEVVADPARRDAAVGIIQGGNGDLEAIAKRLEKIAKGFRAADEDQAAGLDTLTPFVEQALEARRQGQKLILDRMFRLRGTLTEGEWEAGFAKLEEKP